MVQCTPKTGDKVSSTEDKAKQSLKDKAKESKRTAEVEAVGNQPFRTQAPEALPAPKIELSEYESFKLDNELQVIVVENNKLPQVSFQIFVDVPPIYEKDQAGYVDMAGELLNKGTAEKSKADIDEAVDFIGATLSTNSRGMFGSSLSRHKEKLLDLMSDVLLNPSFPQAEFDKLKKQTLSALQQEKDDPNSIASKVGDRLNFGDNHPYGEVVTTQTVENITLDQTKDYYKTYFQPDRSYLVVVGDITAKEAQNLAIKYFGKWTKTQDIKSEKMVPPALPKETTVDFVPKDGAVQSVIRITHPINIKPGDKDLIPLRVANTMLGGFFQSKLNDNLREDKGYTYGARSRVNDDPYIGDFVAFASVRNEVTDSSLVEFMREMNSVRNEALSNSDLELVKNVMTGSFARSLERPQTIARFALNTFRYNLPKDYYATYLENLSRVNQTDIMRVAKQYIRPDQAHVVVVGNKDEVANKLDRFSANGVVNFYSTDGEPVKEIDEEIPSGMTAQKVVEEYLKAIGGKDKIDQVKTLAVSRSTSVQGMAMSVNQYISEPGKLAIEIGMNGAVMQKQIYNSGKGKSTGMTGNKEIEGEELEGMKEQAFIIPEHHYGRAYALELKGIDQVDGAKAYKIGVTSPAGKSSTLFFDATSFLKLKSTTVAVVNGESVSTSTKFGEYKEVDGLKYPHLIIQSMPGLPIPLELKVETIELNKPIDDAIFAVD